MLGDTEVSRGTHAHRGRSVKRGTYRIYAQLAVYPPESSTAQCSQMHATCFPVPCLCIHRVSVITRITIRRDVVRVRAAW